MITLQAFPDLRNQGICKVKPLQAGLDVAPYEHLLYGFPPPETHDLPVTVKMTHCGGTPANRYLIRQPKVLQYFYNGELKRASEGERQAGWFELFLDCSVSYVSWIL